AGLAGISTDKTTITINRICSSSLQRIAYGAERIMLGQRDTIIAGGAESMSLIPIGGHVIRPNPELVIKAPEYYMGMGHTAEEVENKFSISRAEQDAFAAQNYERAEATIKSSKYK